MEELNNLTHKIIGCAIAVDRELGPGLLEATYEAALCIVNFNSRLLKDGIKRFAL